MNRVVITGLGPVSSIGIGASTFYESLQAGRSGISRITSFDPSGFPHVHAGEVRGFSAEAIVRRVSPASWGRSSLLAAAAARLAFDDAQLDIARVAPDRIGVVMGTTCGESQLVEVLTEELLVTGFDGMSTDLVRRVDANRLAFAASEEIGAEGESMTIASACAAGNYALGYAFDRLVAGEVDVFVAGGAESVCRWVHAGFFRLGILAERFCAPFDQGRTGLLTAEGGAALVLETLDHARQRGARPYAEVLGYGLNCDAKHPVGADAASIADCMRLAHKNASVCPEDIDYICAHGTGTRGNDLAESRAVHEVFGGRMPPMSSIKSMIGHTMGAASAFGAIASALAITHGFLPPTMNWSTPDPELPALDVVPNEARASKVRVVQNNGFAFGGNNAIVILGAVT
jgi:3-oxoacyl-[acyl-carrier-protein] synthase II